jgi:hypothetical protein
LDRDGLIDGFVTAYLPNVVAVLLLRKGAVANAFAFTEAGRVVMPIGEVLEQMRGEVERSELIFAEAPLEQLGWMYSSCATPAQGKLVDADRPEQLFPALQAERFTGVLELISDGCVNYLRFESGGYVSGYLSAKPDDVPLPHYVHSLFAPREGHKRQVAAAVFPPLPEPPTQAPPELVDSYRDLFWGITARADQETAGAATKHAYRLRDALKNVHTSLEAVGKPRDRGAVRLVASPEELTIALSDWTLQFLEQVEIVAPGAAPDILKDATREQRFMLQRAGFFERLPWTVRW